MKKNLILRMMGSALLTLFAVLLGATTGVCMAVGTDAGGTVSGMEVLLLRMPMAVLLLLPAKR